LIAGSKDDLRAGSGSPATEDPLLGAEGQRAFGCRDGAIGPLGGSGPDATNEIVDSDQLHLVTLELPRELPATPSQWRTSFSQAMPARSGVHSTGGVPFVFR
jgi:hypothetical protein